MQKIISLFKRDYTGTRLVYDEVVPGAEWVLAGEGAATRKLDGTCCMVRNGVLFKRYTLKRGVAPPDFEPATKIDPATGKQEGWRPVDPSDPGDKFHLQAWDITLPDGTYELVGPKIQGNPENYPEHTLVAHGSIPVPAAPRTFNELKRFLDGGGIEGIVWHHSDGRMVKIKARDFGVSR